MSEIEQLVNKPKEFTINEKKVFVEAHPLAAVSLIFQKLINKAKSTDTAKAEFSAKTDKTKQPNILRQEKEELSIEETYSDLSKLLFGNDKLDAEILQMMLVSSKKWGDKRGNFDENDYPVSLEDIKWYLSEETALEIIEEWQARNPRFERQKKMLNLRVEQ